MTKHSRRFFSILLALVMALTTLPLTGMTALAADEPTVLESGYCGGEGDGANLTWTFTDDGVLTISGTGPMADYGYHDYFDIEMDDNEFELWQLWQELKAPWQRFNQQYFALKQNGYETWNALCDALYSQTLAHFGYASYEELEQGFYDYAAESMGYASAEELFNAMETFSKDEDALFDDCCNVFFNRIVSYYESLENACLDAAPAATVTAVVIEPGVTSVGAYSFYQMSLDEVILPATLTTIGTGAFSRCRITRMTMEGVTVIGEGAFASTKIGELALPETLTTIQYAAFFGCYTTRLEIPESVTLIGDDAFRAARTEELVLPSSLETLDRAFDDVEPRVDLTVRNDALDIGGLKVNVCCLPAQQVLIETYDDYLAWQRVSGLLEQFLYRPEQDSDVIAEINGILGTDFASVTDIFAFHYSIDDIQWTDAYIDQLRSIMPDLNTAVRFDDFLAAYPDQNYDKWTENAFLNVCRDIFIFFEEQDWGEIPEEQIAFENAVNAYLHSNPLTSDFMTVRSLSYSYESVFRYLMNRDYAIRTETTAAYEQEKSLQLDRINSRYGIEAESLEELQTELYNRIEAILGAKALKGGICRVKGHTGWCESIALRSALNNRFGFSLSSYYDSEDVPYVYVRKAIGDIAQDEELTPVPWFTIHCGCASLAREQAEAAGINVELIHTPVGEPVSVTPATCTQNGAIVYAGCADCDVGEYTEVIPATGEHIHTEEVAATEATATEHGYTAGVYCADCGTWLSGHEVIHNTLGECTVIKEPTATESGECIIVCTVCTESGLYAMDPAPDDPDQPDTPAQPDEPAQPGNTDQPTQGNGVVER
ncbi:MAG: leucine-rich repeat domain-containing protein, partial [Clostridia bacterium]|nr:leucine-rich repeat domain-containing protein [Clostridia bacterium]